MPVPLVAEPPGRLWLRIAGVTSQLAAGVCLLIGTIGFVLVAQNKTGQLGVVIAWLVAAMVGLVLGGLIYRGGAAKLVAAAVIDAGFGVVLITFDGVALRRLLAILPASDVETIGGGLVVAGVVMIGAGVVCLVALPQGVRLARWSAAVIEPQSTARGFPPPPVPVRAAEAADDQVARRRMYLVLGGLAVAVGAVVGVLVSELRSPARPVIGAGSAGSGSAVRGAPVDAGVAIAKPAPSPTPPVVAPTIAPAPAVAPTTDAPAAATVSSLLTAEHAALATVDSQALAALRLPDAFGFGIDADEVAEGRDAVVAQMVRDLGDPPPGGFTVTAHTTAVGEERGQAWIAEDLEFGGADREPRHFAVSALAAVAGGKWLFIAQHWAVPVSDATAERMAILNTLPTPRVIADRHDGDDELDRAVRAAFASKAAFVDARSERADAFNFGSGGERALGGTAIKKIFTRLKAQIRLHDGARVVAGSQWDPAQRSAPRIAWAAVNVDFTAKSRAATDVTQTFRVLAVLIKDGGAWQLVQTQWSNGGPIR